MSIPDYNVSILSSLCHLICTERKWYTYKYCKLAKAEKIFSVKFWILFPFKYLQNNKEENDS